MNLNFTWTLFAVVGICRKWESTHLKNRNEVIKSKNKKDSSLILNVCYFIIIALYILIVPLKWILKACTSLKGYIGTVTTRPGLYDQDCHCVRCAIQGGWLKDLNFEDDIYLFSQMLKEM